MPIYEYRCAACGHTLDALQKLNDGPLRKCPECRKSTLKRLMSAPSFRLKGGGWYETDFKNDGEKKRNLVETAASESADTGSANKSDDGKDGAGKDGTGKEAAGKEPKTTEKADGAAADAAKPAAKPKESAAAKAPPAKKRASRSARSARR